MCVYIYIYIYTCIYTLPQAGHGHLRRRRGFGLLAAKGHRIRDKDLYTTANKCLQRLINILYTVF